MEANTIVIFFHSLFKNTVAKNEPAKRQAVKLLIPNPKRTAPKDIPYGAAIYI